MAGFTKSIGLTLITATLFLTAGCGDDGPTRYRLSGIVTHNGAPLPSGVIFFDSQAGGTASGFAAIIDGEYDTAENGKGHLGGKHTVRISVEKPEGSQPDWQPPFPPYETTADLPNEKSTKDFDVPAVKSSRRRRR